jgi:hypothetical protein
VNTSFFFSAFQKGCNCLPLYAGKIILLTRTVDPKEGMQFFSMQQKRLTILSKRIPL